MKKRIVLLILLMSVAGGVAAYLTSLDSPQDFPTNI